MPGQRTRDNTTLVVDSASDLPTVSDDRRRWPVVPMHVHLDGRDYRDSVDLTTQGFYERLRSGGAEPRTSQPSPGEFEAVFRAALAERPHAVAVIASARASGAFESARLAAGGLDGVQVVDSGSVSGAIVLLADAIERRLDHGTSPDEIEALAGRFREQACALVALDTLEYLVRGGRVSRVAGLAGQLAHLKPVLRLVDGEVTAYRRVRGRARALELLVRTFAAEAGETPRVAIAHADAQADADRLAEQIAALRPRARLDFRGLFGPALGSHSGPDALALMWFDDD